MMDWKQLLSPVRLGREKDKTVIDAGRSPFQQDIDRIVFSGAFRRLAHKTQVHPLSENDNVHTRLTHSIEVASVGRSLGTIIGAEVSKKVKLAGVNADTFGYIVQAACLAHDIGNPPFGHSGEDAIAEWFSKDNQQEEIFGKKPPSEQVNDLKFFEGNAQGFRILTQLENYRGKGGLQLTYAVLGTFTKYPSSSGIQTLKGRNYVGEKKNGFFNSEKEYFKSVATELGLKNKEDTFGSWSRHPLAFLVEAADDICYAIIDIEDAYLLGYITFKEAKDVLAPMSRTATLPKGMQERAIIGKLRAVAIGELVKSVTRAFLDNQKALLEGKYDSELILETPHAASIKKAKALARRKIYLSERKTKIEIAGSVIISGLLDLFFELVKEAEKSNWKIEKLKGRNQKIARIVPDGFIGISSRYDAWLRVTDFISGMTDRYALELYRKLKGISI